MRARSSIIRILSANFRKPDYLLEVLPRIIPELINNYAVFVDCEGYRMNIFLQIRYLPIWHLEFFSVKYFSSHSLCLELEKRMLPENTLTNKITNRVFIYTGEWSTIS